MHKFIKSFLDSKMSIFEEYGAFEHKYLFLQEKKNKTKKKKTCCGPLGIHQKHPTSDEYPQLLLFCVCDEIWKIFLATPLT